MKRKSAWQGKAEELAEELAKRSTPEESRLVVNSLRDELAGRDIQIEELKRMVEYLKADGARSKEQFQEWQAKSGILAEHLYTLVGDLVIARANASPDALSCVFLGQEEADQIDANTRVALDSLDSVKVDMGPGGLADWLAKHLPEDVIAEIAVQVAEIDR